MQLDLSAEDCKFLVEILERTLSETRVEARRTADRAMRDGLHGEEERLRQLLERVRGLA